MNGGPAIRFRIAFTPAPPSHARRLTIEIAELVNPFPVPPDSPLRAVNLHGSWPFEVALPPRAREQSGE